MPSEAKLRAIAALGGRCMSKNCRWQNDDGTFGCTEVRVLHLHHRDGGGSEARRNSRDSTQMNRYEVLRDVKRKRTPRFELLCANCHEIESGPRRMGARLHKKPARMGPRRSSRTSANSPGET